PAPPELVRQATARAAHGDLAGAADLYGRAAAANRRIGRREDEARCLTLLATCQRLSGDLEAAADSVARARRLLDEEGAGAVSAATEDGEVNVAGGRVAAAITCLDDALSGQPPAAIGAPLLRRRAVLLTGLNRTAEAYRDFTNAAAQLTADGSAGAARRILV